MNLTEKPDTVQWPETHYVFVEKTGPFQNTAPQSWQELHRHVSAISQHNTIEKYFSLYDCDKQIYRAGVSLSAAPSKLPDGLQYELIPGGKYSRFTLIGSYSQLPDASRQVFEIVADKKIPLRDGYNIENYVTDPRTTPEDQLVTEIMLPAA